MVPRLPRDAQVEWCVWAHRDNTRFECRQNDCRFNISRVCLWLFFPLQMKKLENVLVISKSPSGAAGITKITCRRLFVTFLQVNVRRMWRWKIVINTSIRRLSGSSNSTGNLVTEPNSHFSEPTSEELMDAFEYLLCKLTKGSQLENPTCSLRIFYKVGTPPGPSAIQEVLRKLSSRNLVSTIIPTTHLQNFSTFLSVCGIRHEWAFATSTRGSCAHGICDFYATVFVILYFYIDFRQCWRFLFRTFLRKNILFGVFDDLKKPLIETILCRVSNYLSLVVKRKEQKQRITNIPLSVFSIKGKWNCDDLEENLLFSYFA